MQCICNLIDMFGVEISISSSQIKILVLGLRKMVSAQPQGKYLCEDKCNLPRHIPVIWQFMSSLNQ